MGDPIKRPDDAVEDLEVLEDEADDVLGGARTKQTADVKDLKPDGVPKE